MFDANKRRKLDIDDMINYEGKSLKQAKKDVDSFWSYLYGKKSEDFIKLNSGDIVNSDNVKSYIPDVSLDMASGLAEELRIQDMLVKEGISTWDDYYKKMDEGSKKYIPDLIKGTQDVSKITGDDIVKANEKAQKSTVDYNNSLKQMTFGAKAAKFAMSALATVSNMLLMTAIMSGISWLLNYNKRLKEARQEMIENGKEAAQLTKDLDNLTEQYRKLGADGTLDDSDKEKAKQIQEQIVELLGDEARNIDLVNGNYDTQIKKLQEIMALKAKGSRTTLGEAKDAAMQEVRSVGGGVGFGLISMNSEKKALEKALKEIHMEDRFAEYGFKITTTEGIDGYIKSYEDMIELRDHLYDSYNKEIKTGGDLHDFYNELSNKITKLSGAIEAYKAALNDYSLNEAVLIFNNKDNIANDYGLEGFNGANLDKNGVKGYIEKILSSDNEKLTNEIQENLIGLTKTYYPEYIDIIEESVKKHLEEKVAALGAGSATEDMIEELLKEGKACGKTTSEMSELIAKNILFNNTNLSVDDKIKALAKLQKEIGITSSGIISLANGINGFSGGAFPGIPGVIGSTFGKNPATWLGEYSYGVIANKNNKSNILKEYGITKAVMGSGYYYNGTSYETEEDAIEAAIYDDFLKSLGNENEDNGDDGSNPTGDDKKNEALDNYLTNAEARYKIHQNETLYVEDLNYALKNLAKTEKEKLEITDKIDKAYRDQSDNRIKDIEHQINMTKELNGEDNSIIESYNDIQNLAHKEANRYREFARNKLGYYAMGVTDEIKTEIDEMIENTDEIQLLQKKWWDAENGKLDFYTKQHENIIRDIEHARDMALEQNPYLDTTLYYKQMQDEYHKQAELLRALDPEKYKEEIQELQQAWWDAQEGIVDWSYSNSERWISERNTYNDWELYGDNEVAAWERVLKRFQTEFPNELEKIKDIEQKIFEARKAAMEKSIDDIEDYIDARNTYNDWDAYGDSEVKAIQRQTKIIEDMYNQRLLSYEEYVDRLEEQSQRIYSLAQSEIDKNLSNIDKYINARNHYNDWDEFGDSEIDAIKRQIQYLDAAYEQKLISYEDYTERVAEYTQKMYSVAKDSIIEEVLKLIEDYEEMKQFESSQLESQKTLLQSYYNVANAIAEAQHEIDKELKASQSMHEYLDEGTRELLFNQEDYDTLSEKLLDIQSAANELQEQYNNDILNATEETISEITSQYQMQYETMMKQYEIAKAELDVAKKRQKLDNVLAERNTRMFIDGQWQWVANTQNVIDAQNELAEAENERKKREAELEQTESLNKFTEQINSLETDLNKVRKYWTDMQEMLNGESDEVAKALKEISQVSSPELKRVIEATGGSVGSFSTSLSINTETMSEVISSNLSGMSLGIGGFITNLKTYSDAIITLADKISGAKTSSSSSSMSVTDVKAQMAANSAAWLTASTKEERDRLHQKNVELGELIDSDYDEVTGKWTHKYATGTKYTQSGLALMGEDGEEFYIPSGGRLIPIAQPTIGNIGAGGVVFNREQMANLRTLWDWSNLGKITPSVSASNVNKQNTTIDNSIHINGLTVSEQGNEDWINGLRRYVATHK